MRFRTLTLGVALIAAAPATAQTPPIAQTTDPRPIVSAELAAGYAAFVDDAPIDHAVVAGSGRIHVSPRLSVGPELVYMRGPEHDRDWFLTGNLTFDFVPQRVGVRRAVNPFLVVGGGFMHHRDRFAQTFTSTEGAVTGGGGARVWIGERVYALGEFRLGWEPHYRITGGIGLQWR